MPTPYHHALAIQTAPASGVPGLPVCILNLGPTQPDLLWVPVRLGLVWEEGEIIVRIFMVKSTQPTADEYSFWGSKIHAC